MEHIDEGMDDLFRKAGDHYPLRTSGSDWDGVLGKLREEIPGDQESLSGINAKDKNKRRRWGLLLLLIPIALASVIYYSPGNNNKDTLNSNPVEQSKTKVNTDAEVKKAGGEKSSQQDLTRMNEEKQSTNKVKTISDIPSGSEVYQKNKLPSNRIHAPSVVLKKSKTGEQAANGMSSIASASGNQGSKSIPPADNSPDPMANGKIAAASTVASASLASGGGSGDQNGQNKKGPVVDSLPANKTNPADSLTAESIKKKSDSANKSQKGFYVSFLAGPDWTTVKFQSVMQTGFSVGVLAGYRFNNRISLESGLLWDKKYYYSTAEYFNTSKLPIHPGDTVVNLNGYCNMFEIPLTIRYSFGNNKNHGYYVKIGFDSYLMKKEQYSFLIDSITTYQSKTHSYKNTSQTLFAVFQLSGGYEMAVGNKTKIWIEPYFKIPLQHVGITSISISSAGLYFGMTYSFK